LDLPAIAPIANEHPKVQLQDRVNSLSIFLAFSGTFCDGNILPIADEETKLFDEKKGLMMPLPSGGIIRSELKIIIDDDRSKKSFGVMMSSICN